ncbi:TPA: hypothetical protein NGS02_001129 [Vibrio parahaemolyticus]|uniref:hypothetical protein n=2 Tax=Vibrio parahaemolyticus TaxID=670 RepID=UPI00111D1BF8|nr:hypothetical protein [Vibrio parahaemolyticus]MCC4218907.1 hypothetical protein [Vibrio parahaemolyticus]MDG2648221.1 hypothetical protein [Vibrio parahaemolyticus]TOI86242.1 hypothetical protein CGI51_18715 [Vibrio parahaemolyticus]HCE4591604.1 hypothetical protein [Vibrio parahaemolyticus]HCG5925602.1 hypothetical protein [Vibrio parahaemolyticus]
MKQLDDLILKDILSRTDGVCDWQRDFSSLLSMGVTLSQIALVLDTAKLLRTDPTIDDLTLCQGGVSQYALEKTIGTTAKLKQLMGLEYGFDAYLRNAHFDPSVGMSISYYIFQQFYQEIRADYSIGTEIDHQITVELGDNLELSAIPLFKQFKELIPATDSEAANVTAKLLLDQYEYVGYFPELSILALRTRDDAREVRLEVRCLSSQFSFQDICGVCVVDDREVCKPEEVDRQARKLSFAHLIKRHMFD